MSLEILSVSRDYYRLPFNLLQILSDSRYHLHASTKRTHISSTEAGSTRVLSPDTVISTGLVNGLSPIETSSLTDNVGRIRCRGGTVSRGASCRAVTKEFATSFPGACPPDENNADTYKHVHALHRYEKWARRGQACHEPSCNNIPNLPTANFCQRDRRREKRKQRWTTHRQKDRASLPYGYRMQRDTKGCLR